ncbi:MAG: ABC transporter ATP-binding protein [Planctomycetota bacterium]
MTPRPPHPAHGSGPSRRRRPSVSSIGHVVRKIIWPRWRLLAVGLALIVINRLCGLVLPGSSKYLLDDVIGKGNTAQFGPLLAVVGGAIAIQAASAFFLTRLLSIEAQHLIAEMRAQIQRHVLRLPIRFFDRTRSGELVSRIMNDVEGVRNLVGTGLVQLIGGILTSVLALVMLLRINPGLTLLATIPLVLFAVISSQAFRRIRPIFRERSAITAQVVGRLTESLAGVRIVKGFNAEDREEAAFGSGVERIFENVRRTLTAQSLVMSLSTLLLGATSVSIMWMGGRAIVAGTMTVGDFLAFTLYLAFMVAPLIQMAAIGTQLTEAFAGLDRMEELLGEPRELDDPRRVVRLPEVRGEFRFEHVGFEYEAGTPVIHDVSFTAAPGTVTAFVGSSGSGKSTLAGLAASFLTPTSGRILIDGIDLATVELPSYRQCLGLVLQDDFLFDGTIRDNIRFARPSASEEDLESAVRAAHVREFTDRFEKGLDTIVGERGVKLSGGQRQRVAIARALLAAPRVLVLDEATSSLDTDSERFIQESLEGLLLGRTTFVIAHRLSTIRRADQILVLDGGRIVERGTHDELIARAGRYHHLHSLQARI